MSYVGFAEEIDVDVKRWLTRLDIWDEVGASGWGEDGKQSILFGRQWRDGRQYTQGVEEVLRQGDGGYGGIHVR